MPLSKTSLTAEEKNLADVCAGESHVAWQQFNQRRDYEFKVTLALWSALGAILAGALTVDKFPVGPDSLAIAVGFGIAIVLLHSYWCIGVHRAQEKDRSVALFYRGTLNELCALRFSDELQKKLEPGRRLPTVLRWSFVAQVMITLLLAMCLVAVSWERMSEPAAKSTGDLERQKLELEISKLRAEVGLHR